MNTPIKFTTAEEAVKVIKSGDHVHLSSVASAPQCLIKAMCARGEAGELKNVTCTICTPKGRRPMPTRSSRVSSSSIRSSSARMSGR